MIVCGNNLTISDKTRIFAKTKVMTELFSQRYGYTSIEDVVIREDMPTSIQNAICNCYDRFPGGSLQEEDGFVSLKYSLSEYLWTYFLNQRTQDFYENTEYGDYSDIFIDYILCPDYPWYSKLNLLEVTLSFIDQKQSQNRVRFEKDPSSFEKDLNTEFTRLNYAYRIIDHKIVEITSKSEIESIEQAINDGDNKIKMHLSSAIEQLSKRPKADYRNSIKESISAVETWCRARTNEDDLRTALNRLQSKGVTIHSKLRSTFIKLYEYTNNEKTGIRHALMDDEETYTPTMNEAIYMLVTCSAFINYLNKKVITENLRQD